MSNAQCPVKTLENFSHKSQSWPMMRCNETRLREDLKAQAKAFPHVGIFKVDILYCVDKTKIQFSDTIKDVANVTNLQSRNIALR